MLSRIYVEHMQLPTHDQSRGSPSGLNTDRMFIGRLSRSIDDAKVISQLESLAMQTVEAQVGMARNQATATANKLSAEGWAMAEIAKATGDASVMQARIDAENQSKLSKVGGEKPARE